MYFASKNITLFSNNTLKECIYCWNKDKSKCFLLSYPGKANNEIVTPDPEKLDAIYQLSFMRKPNRKQILVFPLLNVCFTFLKSKNVCLSTHIKYRYDAKVQVILFHWFSLTWWNGKFFGFFTEIVSKLTTGK